MSNKRWKKPRFVPTKSKRGNDDRPYIPSLFQSGNGTTIFDRPMPRLLNDDKVEVKILKGTKVNPLGHAVLRVDSIDGPVYLHVDRIISYPQWMTEGEWMSYSRKYGIVGSHHIPIPNPKGMVREIKHKMSHPYLWIGSVHDCMDFVDMILRAGDVNVAYFDLWKKKDFRE